MVWLSSFALNNNMKCSKCNNNIISASTKGPDARFLSDYSLTSGKRKSAQGLTPASGALKPQLMLKVWLYTALTPATETKDSQDPCSFSLVYHQENQICVITGCSNYRKTCSNSHDFLHVVCSQGVGPKRHRRVNNKPSTKETNPNLSLRPGTHQMMIGRKSNQRIGKIKTFSTSHDFLDSFGSQGVGPQGLAV